MGFSDLGKKLSKLGQDTKNGVQKMSDSVSISNRITAEKKSLERLFASIGETVYKETPDDPKEGLEDEWAAVKVAYANIASLNDQLNHVKGIIYCPNCGKPAAQGDKFCARCGFRLDNLHESTGSRMAEDIKEAGREVGRIATGAADRTGEMVGGAAADTKNFFTKFRDSTSKFMKETGRKFRGKIREDGVKTEDLSGAADFLDMENGAPAQSVNGQDSDTLQESQAVESFEAAAVESAMSGEIAEAVKKLEDDAVESERYASAEAEKHILHEGFEEEDSAADPESDSVPEGESGFAEEDSVTDPDTLYGPENGLAGDLGEMTEECAAEAAEAAAPAEAAPESQDR